MCLELCVTGVQTVCMLVSGRYSLQLLTKHVHTCSACHHNSSVHPRCMHELTVDSFDFHDSDPEFRYIFRFIPRHCKACMESSWSRPLPHSCRKWKRSTWQTAAAEVRFIVTVASSSRCGCHDCGGWSLLLARTCQVDVPAWHDT